jgi:hypothetical protein
MAVETRVVTVVGGGVVVVLRRRRLAARALPSVAETWLLPRQLARRGGRDI